MANPTACPGVVASRFAMQRPGPEAAGEKLRIAPGRKKESFGVTLTLKDKSRLSQKRRRDPPRVFPTMADQPERRDQADKSAGPHGRTPPGACCRSPRMNASS